MPDRNKYIFPKETEFNFSPYFYLKMFPEYVDKVYIEYDKMNNDNEKHIQNIQEVKSEKIINTNNLQQGKSLFNQSKNNSKSHSNHEDFHQRSYSSNQSQMTKKIKNHSNIQTMSVNDKINQNIHNLNNRNSQNSYLDVVKETREIKSPTNDNKSTLSNNFNFNKQVEEELDKEKINEKLNNDNKNNDKNSTFVNRGSSPVPPIIKVVEADTNNQPTIKTNNIIDNFNVFNDFIDNLDVDININNNENNGDFFITKDGNFGGKTAKSRKKLKYGEPEQDEVIDKSIRFDPDPISLIPNSLRSLVNYIPPKTAGTKIKFYPPQDNIHLLNMKMKNANYKKLNNNYGIRSSSSSTNKNFEKYLNRELGKISNSYGKLENLKKFTQRPRTNMTTFNQLNSYDKYSALKLIENVDIKAKLRPMTNLKNQSLEKLSKHLFENMHKSAKEIKAKPYI